MVMVIMIEQKACQALARGVGGNVRGTDYFGCHGGLRACRMGGSMAKAALGKGLGALISSATAVTEPQDGESVVELELTRIVPTPLQPRKVFRPESLHDLIDSVRERGIIQPLIVRRVRDQYELIAGERRWRAAREVGLRTAPVIVRPASDLEVLELALVENLQREDLNPIEEAQAYARLAREFQLKQDDISRKVGKNRATVANAMRLLDLHEDIQTLVAKSRLTVGHAKVLLTVKDKEAQCELARQIVRSGATVRASEQMVSRHLHGRDGLGAAEARRAKAGGDVPASVRRLENRLREHLATHVRIRHGGKKGRIEIEYYGNDDLDRLLDVLGLPPDG